MTAGGAAKRTANEAAATAAIPVPRQVTSDPGAYAPRLAKSLPIERTWTTDREAMAAALRVVLGMPRVVSSLRGQEQL